MPRKKAWVRIVLTKYADMIGVETRAGASDGEDERRAADRPLDAVTEVRRPHAGLPKSPRGRNASTSASSANVMMIE